ncbi:MAG: glycine cleavage system protein H [Sulfobacillus thermotolerans]|nr:glycine cleavage system protein H [Sulfobacillus thermotolerans]
MAIEPIHRWKVVPGRLYDRHHQWVLQEDVLITVGVTDYTQDTAGDILYAALPDPGTVLVEGMPFGSIESGKWVGQLYAPFDGVVIVANALVQDDPQILNRDPYGQGWLIKARATTSLENLLSADAYSAWLSQQDVL